MAKDQVSLYIKELGHKESNGNPEHTKPEIRGKVIKLQEFYSKVHGKVCTRKNLISRHKIVP
jgi:hypothetical protein